MANRDVDVRSDTWTRAELLTQRGYPEAIVNGNGHDSGEPTPATTAVAIPTDEPAESGSRTCSECGKPVATGRRWTCGPVCAKARDRRQELERKRARRATPLPPSVSGGRRDTSPGPEPVTVPPLELETVAPPPLATRVEVARELETETPPATLEAHRDQVAVSLADDLEEAAGLLRRIARRLTG